MNFQYFFFTVRIIYDTFCNSFLSLNSVNTTYLYQIAQKAQKKKKKFV